MSDTDADIATIRRSLPRAMHETLDRLVARLEQAEAERDEEMDAVGLPLDAPLSALVRHHRANAALAVGFDKVAAEARVMALEAALWAVQETCNAGHTAAYDLRADILAEISDVLAAVEGETT